MNYLVHPGPSLCQVQMLLPRRPRHPCRLLGNHTWRITGVEETGLQGWWLDRKYGWGPLTLILLWLSFLTILKCEEQQATYCWGL